jgi:hypothetical protein
VILDDAMAVLGLRSALTAKKTNMLSAAAKKHHTDVNASRRMMAAATTDIVSTTPSVRASRAVDTKKGAIVETMYASTSNTCKAGLLVPG